LGLGAVVWVRGAEVAGGGVVSGPAAVAKRILVCGGRAWGVYLDSDTEEQKATARDQVASVVSALDAVRRKHGEIVIVHGAAQGADTAAWVWAARCGVPMDIHRADWDKHGRRAGPIRNAEMLASGVDAVVAFPGGRGTADMVAKARKSGVPVWLPCG
jgi:predicted Rossmann-fold nucleotide-binding protein